jgi:tetratricopeptide (TPR) repeat protein
LTDAISGTVSDANGKVVANARLELRDTRTGITVATGYSRPNGGFELSAPSGDYELVVQSGTAETRERVTAGRLTTLVNVRLPGEPRGADAAGDMVSVGALKAPKKARKEFARAQEAFDDGNLKEAKERVAKALEAFPEFANALTLQAILCLRDGNAEAATPLLERAIKSDPRYALAYTVLASAYNTQRRWDDALRAVERAVATLLAVTL